MLHPATHRSARLVRVRAARDEDVQQLCDAVHAR